MKIIDYTSLKEIGEEILYIEYENNEWKHVGYLWDLWFFLTNKGLVKIDYDTFIANGLWKNLVTIEEMTTFVESLKDSKNTII